VALTRLMRGLLYAVEPTDPATYLLVAALLATVAALAISAPAFRAARVAPAEVLRSEQERSRPPPSGRGFQRTAWYPALPEPLPMLEQLRVSSFSPYLSQTFRVQLPEGDLLELTLIEVSDLGPSADAEGGSGDETRRVPFSVLFRGASEPVLQQRIYRLEHPEMGGLELFLVPVGPDAEGMRYEAVFN
jgi:hypothetical protein